MCDFQPLSIAGENDRVVSDNIAGSDRAKTDGILGSRARAALASVNRHIRQIRAPCSGDCLSQTQGRTRRRVNFMPMMSFNDLDIDTVTQCSGSRLYQLKSQVHTRRKVGRLADCEPCSDRIADLHSGRR